VIQALTLSSQITSNLAPSNLEIHNDSSKHSHHKAMADITSKETHFRVMITSEAFGGKGMMARHKMVYALFKEEMAREGGIHALQLRTRTEAEEQKDDAGESSRGDAL
jgi:BolA-like protein 1